MCMQDQNTSPASKNTSYLLSKNTAHAPVAPGSFWSLRFEDLDAAERADSQSGFSECQTQRGILKPSLSVHFILIAFTWCIAAEVWDYSWMSVISSSGLYIYKVICLYIWVF